MDFDWDNMNENQTHQAPVEESESQHLEDEWIYDDDEDGLYEDEDPTINEAVKRIEQAKLYESLLKHDFFAPNSARAEIQDKVTSEIREFILERLIVLVGLKSPKQSEPVPAQLPWNPMQLEAITAMANRLIEKKNPSATPSQPVVQQFYATAQNPQVNVASTPQRAPTKPRRKKRRGEPQKQKADENLPKGTKIDPATGHPVSDNGVVLYKGQVPNKKNKPKRMPSQNEMNMINSAQVDSMTSGNNQSVGSKLLNLAITNAQYNNRNINRGVI